MVSSDATPGAVVVLRWSHIWELTTEHGTRILVDLPERLGGWQWMRLPATRPDCTENRSRTDGRWQRLGTISSSIQATEHEDMLAEMKTGFHIELGQPVRLYRGMNDWWDSTPVVSVRPINALGDLFTTSAISIARAAVREAERCLRTEHVEITVAADDPDDSNKVLIVVARKDGFIRSITVDSDDVHACLDAPAGDPAVHRLVLQLAAEIRLAAEAPGT